jgi:tyrosyl-tRNA synthetase
VVSGLCSSRAEAKRLIAQGGASINEQRLNEGEQPITEEWLSEGELILRAGKKRYLRVVLQ